MKELRLPSKQQVRSVAQKALLAEIGITASSYLAPVLADHLTPVGNFWAHNTHDLWYGFAGLGVGILSLNKLAPKVPAPIRTATAVIAAAGLVTLLETVRLPNIPYTDIPLGGIPDIKDLPWPMLGIATAVAAGYVSEPRQVKQKEEESGEAKAVTVSDELPTRLTQPVPAPAYATEEIVPSVYEGEGLQ